MSVDKLQPFTGNYDLTTKSVLNLKRKLKVTIIKRLDKELIDLWEEDKTEERLRKYSAATVSHTNKITSKINFDKYWADDLLEYFKLKSVGSKTSDIKVLTFEVDDARTSGIFAVNIVLSIMDSNKLTLSLENSYRKYLYWEGKYKGKPIFDPQDIIICEFNKLNDLNSFQSVFIGFIDSVTAGFSGSHHSITITATDITKILKNTVINIKPGIFPSESLGFPQIYENPFVGKTLTYIVLYILTWTYANIDWDDNIKSKIRKLFNYNQKIVGGFGKVSIENFIQESRTLTRDIISIFEDRMFDFIRVFDKDNNEVTGDKLKIIKEQIKDSNFVLDDYYLFYGYTNKERSGEPIFECHLSDTLFPYNIALFSSSTSFVSNFGSLYDQLKTVLSVFSYIMYVDETSKIVVKPLYYTIENLHRRKDRYFLVKNKVVELDEVLPDKKPSNIILNEETISTSYTENDKDIITIGYGKTEFLAMKQSFNFIPIRYIDFRLLQKFGVRIKDYPAYPGLGDPLSHNKIIGEKFFELYETEKENTKLDFVDEVQAYIVSRMKRDNMSFKTYELTIIGKPEVQLGEALFSEHDYIIGLVTNIQHRFTIGQTFTTSVSLLDCIKPLVKVDDIAENFINESHLRIKNELKKYQIRLSDGTVYPEENDKLYKFLLDEYKENLAELYFDGYIWEIFPEIKFSANKAIQIQKKYFQIFNRILDDVRAYFGKLNEVKGSSFPLELYVNSMFIKESNIASVFDKYQTIINKVYPIIKKIIIFENEDKKKMDILYNTLLKLKKQYEEIESSAKSKEKKKIKKLQIPKDLTKQILDVYKILRKIKYNHVLDILNFKFKG